MRYIAICYLTYYYIDAILYLLILISLIYQQIMSRINICSTLKKGKPMEDQIVLDKKFRKELNAGVTSLILLSILHQADEPMYGYQISKYFESEDDHMPPVKQGVLYPVLRSLEKSTLVSSEVEPSVSGPPRRYYRITEIGQETLIRWVEMWKQTVSFVQDVLEGEYNE